jgi:hypothetical protein
MDQFQEKGRGCQLFAGAGTAGAAMLMDSRTLHCGGGVVRVCVGV